MTMTKQAANVNEAFEILTAPGGTCDAFAEGVDIGGTDAEQLMQKSLWDILTELVAEDSFSLNPVLTTPEELVDAFDQIFNRMDADGSIDLKMFPGECPKLLAGRRGGYTVIKRGE